MEGVSAFDALLGGIGWVCANALAKASKFVGVRGVPLGAKARVTAESAVLQGLASLGVDDPECEG